MTEIEELVKRLHQLSNDLTETLDYPLGEKFTVPNEAAACIASLEAQLDQAAGVIKDRNAELSSLKAQLKAFREAAKAVRKNKVARTTHQTVVATDDYDALMSALRNAEGEKDGE